MRPVHQRHRKKKGVGSVTRGCCVHSGERTKSWRGTPGESPAPRETPTSGSTQRPERGRHCPTPTSHTCEQDAHQPKTNPSPHKQTQGQFQQQGHKSDTSQQHAAANFHDTTFRRLGVHLHQMLTPRWCCVATGGWSAPAPSSPCTCCHVMHMYTQSHSLDSAINHNENTKQ